MNPETNEPFDPRSLISETINKTYNVERIERVTNRSIVFKIDNLRLGRKEALKMLKPNQSEERKKQFFKESKTLAQLDGIKKHPNIITISTAGEYQGNPYIVMEYVEGNDLDELLEANRKFSLEIILTIEEELCQALTKASSIGLKHRDIKPGNIRIRKDESGKDTACLVDFGGRLIEYESKEDNDPPKNDVIAISLILEQLLENRENTREKIPERLEHILHNTKQGDYQTPEDFRKAIVGYRKGITRRKFWKKVSILIGVPTSLLGLGYLGWRSHKRHHNYINSMDYIVDELAKVDDRDYKNMNDLFKELDIRVANQKILLWDEFIPKGKSPFGTSEGKWFSSSARRPDNGYLSGIFLECFKKTNDERFKEIANDRIRDIQFSPDDKEDITSVRFFYSHAKGYDITGNEKYKRNALEALNSLEKRFNESNGLITISSENPNLSEAGTMGDIVLFFLWGHKVTGNSKYLDIAKAHVSRVSQSNIRENGSVRKTAISEKR